MSGPLDTAQPSQTTHAVPKPPRLHTQFTGRPHSQRRPDSLEQLAGVLLHLVLAAGVELPADGVQRRAEEGESSTRHRHHWPLRPDGAWGRSGAPPADGYRTQSGSHGGHVIG